ncbi:MAG TPA: hypothetical protein PLS59_09255 [Kiritimatiellia bacterium]|nr:hypothetical protein [Kiritimatiellia bacterium]
MAHPYRNWFRQKCHNRNHIFGLRLTTTWRCDSKCITCSIWKLPPDKRKELSVEEIDAFTRSKHFRQTEYITLSGGDPVTLEIDYKCRVPLVEPPGLDVVIQDREGVVFQGTNIVNGQPFDMLPSAGKFIVRIASLPVNGDYVEFFFCVFQQSTAEIYDWKRHLRLKIKRKKGQRGHILLTANWAVKV